MVNRCWRVRVVGLKPGNYSWTEYLGLRRRDIQIFVFSENRVKERRETITTRNIPQFFCYAYLLGDAFTFIPLIVGN